MPRAADLSSWRVGHTGSTQCRHRCRALFGPPDPSSQNRHLASLVSRARGCIGAAGHRRLGCRVRKGTDVSVASHYQPPYSQARRHTLHTSGMGRRGEGILTPNQPGTNLHDHGGCLQRTEAPGGISPLASTPPPLRGQMAKLPRLLSSSSAARARLSIAPHMSRQAHTGLQKRQLSRGPKNANSLGQPRDSLLAIPIPSRTSWRRHLDRPSTLAGS